MLVTEGNSWWEGDGSGLLSLWFKRPQTHAPPLPTLPYKDRQLADHEPCYGWKRMGHVWGQLRGGVLHLAILHLIR